MSCGQEAALEGRMRPIGAHRHAGVGAERHERKRFRAAKLEREGELERFGLRKGQTIERCMQPGSGGDIARARREGVGLAAKLDAGRGADAERVGDAEHELGRAPFVAARAVLPACSRGQIDRATGRKAGGVEPRLVDAARFLRELRIHRPFDARRRHADDLRFAVRVGRLVQLAVDGLALHHRPVALVRDREIRAGHRLALAPAFGDAGDGFVAPRLPLRDQVADHADGNHENERQGAHQDGLHQECAVHECQPGGRGWHIAGQIRARCGRSAA